MTPGMTWQAFVDAYGSRVLAHHLAAVVGQSVEAIHARRCAVTPRRQGTPYRFARLFAMWHGRPPAESEWPRPRKIGGQNYEWLPPELTFLATLVGTMSVPAMSVILTDRLRAATGDPSAERNRVSVQIAINRIGLQASDVAGGVTIQQAAEVVGTVCIVRAALARGDLRSFRVGRLHVIPRDQFETWRQTRETPPVGWVRLATLAKPLGIHSDSKLPEYAKLGHIPEVVFLRSSNLWFISPASAQQIIADAHAGRALPWHGKPHPCNLRAAWRKWRARQHQRCTICRDIWAPDGPPTTFESFCRAYPALDLGLKRHLTMRRQTWRPRRPWGVCRVFRASGITIAEAARQLGRPVMWVRAQIRAGAIRPLRDPRDLGAPLRISPAALKRLRQLPHIERRGRPPAAWLGIYAAARYAGVSTSTVNNWADARAVRTKPGPRGRLFRLTSLQEQARAYWAAVRFRRATPPSWFTVDERRSA